MTEKLTDIAIIGSGGAETASAIKYSKSPHVRTVHVIPGNDMIPELCEKPVVIHPRVDIRNEVQTAMYCHDLGVGLVDIRQERAIAAGLTDQLRSIWKIPVVGPSRSAGELEWNKHTARSFGEYIHLPQPKYDSISFKYLPFGKKFPDYYDKVLSKYEEGRFFVKAAGLFDGKGVIEAHGRSEIEKAIEFLRQQDKDAAETILIEHPLIGEELSAFAISDGRNFKMLGYAQDHKRAFDGDTGPNTGGMGAVSHPIIADSKLLQAGIKDIVRKTITGQIEGGNPYRGVLYPGLMVLDEVPSVIEFNCRWGDPEEQAMVPGLDVDFFEMGWEAARGTLRRVKISDDGLVRVVVAVATRENYDSKSKTEIKSIKELKRLGNIDLHGARVNVESEKYWIGGSGRIFYVGAAGKNVIEARAKLEPALEMVRSMDGEFLYHRSDIGKQDMARLNQNRV